LERLEDRRVPSTLTVDGSQHFQTIDGFGTNLSSEAWNNGAVTPSLDILLNHGYKLYRVIVEPVQGWEDSNPNTGQFSTTNPNWGYYNNLYGTSTKFTNLWNTINYLKNHGATVWVNLQSDAPAWMTDSGGAIGSIGQDHEADWATMVSTMVGYAINTAHVRIDALGPMNEPDNPGDPVQGPQVGATQYVRMLDTLETQLQGYGLGNIPLVGPDNASSSNAVNQYAPAMVADSFLMPHVLQFGFHTYGGAVSDSAITNNQTYPGRHILSDEYDGPYYNEDHGQRATASQLWAQADASFQNLVSIVNAGENGATIWDGVDNFYLYYNQWSAHGLISYDWTASNPTAQSDYGTTVRLFANAQMFEFAGAGSVVIGASSNASGFIEIAFKNPNGQIVIAGENTGSATQTVTGNLTGGLNAALFNYYLTNSSLDMQQQTDVTITNNTFTFTVAADTIFTLVTPAVPTVTGETPVAGLTTGGQTVTITGSNFTGVTGVAIGGKAATSFTVNSNTQITAVTPVNTVGTVDTTVTGPSGTSTVNTSEKFQYVIQKGTEKPTITNPASEIQNSNKTAENMSVQGTSQYAASTLTYTWTTTGTSPAPVIFNTNGNNTANNVTATFTTTGNYTFQATITDPAGNTVTSSVTVTVSQVATTLTVTPISAFVLPGGTKQFSDTATDQFGNAFSPVTWTVAGGGTIDNTGKFTAGNTTGGPFTVTVTAGSLSANAIVTITNIVNIAPNGTAYGWYSLSSATSNSNKTAAPGLNDNNLTTNVPLKTSDDTSNAYEAGGVTWTTTQSFNKVTFTNGSFNSSTYDGAFDNNFGLQITNDGSIWMPVTGLSLSPAYPYNVPAAAGVTYTFTGTTLSATGVRVVGQVHSRSGNDSWYDNATEVQVFGTSLTNPPPTVSSLNTNSGPLTGVSLTITGSGFTGATAVLFGSNTATFTVNSDTQITATAPAVTTAGTVDTTVTTPNGTSTTTTNDKFTYIAAPTITTQPSSVTVIAGQSASFTVTASGTSLSYQWQKLVSGTWTNISGATASTYTIANTVSTDAGSYWVVVTNVGGSVNSNTVTLTVNPVPPPTITTQASNVTVNAGQSATFTVTASGQGTLTYQWQKLISGAWTNIAGATASSYTITSTATTDAGSYWVIVSNAGGSVTSNSVTLTVNTGGNLALNGTANRWYGMSTETSETHKTSDARLNDNNLTTIVPLTGSGDDSSNAYEAAGVIWSTPQSINQFNFLNGSFLSSYDGVFDNNFSLQSTTDSTTWVTVTGWTLSPAYQYNLSAAANTTYTFTGATISVLGVRAVGQVHSRSGNDSWFDNATEIQAYGATTGPAKLQQLQASSGTPMLSVLPNPVSTTATKSSVLPPSTQGGTKPTQSPPAKPLTRRQEFWSTDWTDVFILIRQQPSP
jgi:hypothetical protein